MPPDLDDALARWRGRPSAAIAPLSCAASSTWCPRTGRGHPPACFVPQRPQRQMLLPVALRFPAATVACPGPAGDDRYLNLGKERL